MAKAKDDCETLMNAVLPFAAQMLTEHGEFFPYGGAMTESGDIVSVAGYDGRDQPPSADLIRQLKRDFVAAAKKAKYKATVVVYDVRVSIPKSGEKSDAIAMALDHREDYSVTLFLPYQLVDGEPVYGEIFGGKGDGDIFRPRKRGWFW
ncbi:MAG TPA: hypothetical protein VMU37_05410 [Caulobacteraceae bacterium]|nr:hypothetical protein [Caulobacteraceae bacterium]